MPNEDALRRGRALHVAQFLTTFQKFFGGNDKERKGPISVDSFKQAVRYRQRLREHYDLEYKLIIRRKDGTLTEDQLKEWHAALLSSQDSIESISASEKALHELLRRFEVWSTQALAKDALMYCTPRSASSASNDDPKAPELICCSTLLNLPGVANFLKIMPQGGNEPGTHSEDVDRRNCKHGHACGLGLPPNAWTWPQYVRICNMVSLLRDPVEASRSPLTAASPSLIGQRKEDLKLSYDSRLTPADLVALWTRAQRNTSALLHLLHVFVISNAPKEPKERREHYSIRADSGQRGKVLVHEHAEETESEPEPGYVAKFVGNHKKTRKFVLSSSKLLDELVEWAVTNQTLYTYRYIREGIQQQKSARKRPFRDYANLIVPTKKSRLISQPPDDATVDTIEVATEDVRARRRITFPNGKEKELLHACQCYVLRWFARRNRKVASIIFTSKFDHVSLFPYETLVQKLVKEKVPDQVKRRLMGDCGSNDRTLARIDRRVRLGKFDKGAAQNFQEVVVSLLNALASCTPDDILAEADVRAACDDFKIFHETFLSGKSAAEAAELLLGADFDTDQDPIDHLLSFAAPWDEHCSACDSGLGDDKVVHCASCDKVFHEKCAGDYDRRSLIDLIQSYDPLAQMFSVRVPNGLTPPDFTSAFCPDLQWTQLSLQIEKKVGPDGRQQKLGFKVRQTEECEVALNQLLNRCPLSVLSTTEMQNSFPLQVNHKGMLVVELMSGAGKFAGLEPGDVITEVSTPTGSDGKSSQKYILDEVRHDERMELLRYASKLSLTVYRPSRSLLTLSRQWLWRVQEANAVYADTLNLQPGGVWYCSNCPAVTEPSGTENRIYAEARWCKSLIRSLGMESYSRSFQDELQSTQTRIPINASLRRLDAMMEFISLKHDESLTPESTKEKLNSMGNPFMLPPLVVSPSPRISWSPEEMEQTPMELLCKGIDMMMSPTDPDQEPLKDERIALLRRFLMIFSVRFLCIRNESPTLRPSGLISHAFLPHPPWIQASCIACQSRPKITADSKCDRKGCQRPLLPQKENSGQSEKGDRVSFSPQNSARDSPVAGSRHTHVEPASFMHPKTGSDEMVCEYDELSSLVGTPLLALPGDPILQHVSKELNQSIDHMDRPMVFVVASYLPHPYGQLEFVSSNQSGKGEGVFHILPVLTADQLRFLLTKCEMRRPAETYATNDSWTELQAFRLNGVIRMSAAELRMKLKETAAIRKAIDAAVGAIASFSTIADQSLDCHDEGFVAGATMITVSFMLSEADHGRAPDLIDEHSTLIDGLMRCHSPFIRHMIDALRTNDTNETDAIDVGLAVSKNHPVDVDDTACDDETDLGGGETAEQNSDSACVSLSSKIVDQHQHIEAAASMETLLGSVTFSEGPVSVPVSEVPITRNANRMNQNFEPQPQSFAPLPLPLPRRVLARNPQPPAERRDATARHRYISMSDVYHSGLPGTVLTRIETAFLVEAQTRSLPLLGRRLLCPRYNLGVTGYQQELVLRGDCSSIPRVQSALWDHIIRLDYDRILLETGEAIMIEGDFAYSLPDGPLPLDRLTESFLVSSSADRIRGGAPSSEGRDDIENDAVSQAHILANIPKEEWQNSLVHSRCQTTQQGNDVGQAIMIGVVQRLLSAERPGEEAGDGEVPVAVFYLSSVGLLTNPPTVLIAADQLRIVQNGSDEARIAGQCELVPRLIAPCSRRVFNDRMNNVAQDAEAPVLDPTDTIIFNGCSSKTQDELPQPQAGRTKRSSMLEAASQLAQRLCHRREGPTPIGDLPDGRAVLWLHSDPRALYIRMPTNDELAIASYRDLQTLPAIPATPDEEIGTGSNDRDCECYSCPWGCDSRAPAATPTAIHTNGSFFTSPSQLRDHLRTEHDFGLQAYDIEIEGGGQMYRIAEGDSISTLSFQLKTTIHARFLFLSKVLDKPFLGKMRIEETTALNVEKTMALIPDGRGGPGNLRRLLLLWSKITRLFAAETTGLFRLEPGEWEAQASFEDQERSTDIAESTQLATNGCLVEKLNAWACGGSDSVDCELCHSRLESATEVNIERTRADRVAPLAHGAPSCALLCQFFDPDHATESVSAHGHGLAGVARSLIIRIASSIPTALRQVDANGGHAPSATGGYVWEEGNYQNWRYLVERARDAKTFLQAFIVLVRSISTTKLPRWWKGAREGWSSSLVTMDVSSFSGLFLHLYVFDAAIFEYLTSTGTALTRLEEKHYMPEELKGLTTKKIMAKVQKWVTEMNYARFDGENDEECLLCGEGGDLICCEFCSNVQHAACCQPPINDESMLDIWACLPCINDFAVKYSAMKEGT